jgi:hypothetical protein
MFEQIIEGLPELQRLEATVSDLEAKHGQATARVEGLALRTAQAREHDLNAEALALNAGRRHPNASEPGLREQLEGAGRDAEVLQRRLALAVADRGRYISENHKLLLGLLGESHATEGQRVAAAAEEALAALLRRFGAEDAARDLQRRHPAPAAENVGGPQSVVTVWGNLTTQNAGGVNRGALEGTLRQLVAMGEATIVEAGAEEGDDDVDAA